MIKTEAMSDHPDQVAFWQGRYESGQTSWDLGRPSPHFEVLLERHTALPRGRVAVLGAGRGHDAALFARHGFEVTAFDYAPGAIEAARMLYGDSIAWRQADLFDLPRQPQWTGYFDYVLEHTCFCAISPKRREEYVQTADTLLKPGGELLGIFWQHGDWGGPPYSTTPEQIRQLFEPMFRIEQLTPMSESAAGRNGTEWFARLRKKA